jgi:hypothetical protein
MSETRCPKCGEPVAASAAACARCGLARDRFDGFAAEVDAEAPAALAALWSACEAAWDAPEPHDRFVAAAVVTGSFRFAAARYRQALRARPDDPIAAERLADVGRRAEAALLDAASQPREKPDANKRPYQGALVVLVLLAALIGLGLVYALVRGSGP